VILAERIVPSFVGGSVRITRLRGVPSNGRATQRITRTHEGGTIERTDVAPDGTSTTTWHAPFRAHKTRSSDGTMTVVRELPHPVHGWQARYPGTITTILPSGASIVVQQRIVGTEASHGTLLADAGAFRQDAPGFPGPVMGRHYLALPVADEHRWSALLAGGIVVRSPVAVNVRQTAAVCRSFK